MATLYNLGSVNIDWVYGVPHVVRPGETLSANDRQRHAGGKGANQSVAAARAGQTVAHVGRVGAYGDWLVELLTESGVDTRHLIVDHEVATGHAVIQVEASGENAIFLFPGANHGVAPEYLRAVLSGADDDDWVLTQNETGNAADVLAAAAGRGLRLAFNPAPITDDLKGLEINGVDLLIVNETEAAAFDEADDEQSLVRALGQRVRGLAVLTLGARGAIASDGQQVWSARGHRVERVVDTTGAGDTFTG